MSKEKQMIKIIQEQLPRSSAQYNKVFEADAEIVDFKADRLVYNIDEFSQEDMFREKDPYTLGWNMAVGSISDIFACGGIPIYYAHNLVIHESWKEAYVKRLAKGIGDVLTQLEISFIGGDFGISKTWRYTGSVIGEIEGEPMLRSNARVGDFIYITGDIGLGNIEAGLKIYSDNLFVGTVTDRFKNRFKLRKKEASFIKRYSRACIDTSDGVFNALNTLSELSSVGFKVSSLPYETGGIMLAKLLNLPKEMLFLGECGEYELLFTIDPKLDEEFIQESKQQGLLFHRIGTILEPGIKLLYENDKNIDLNPYNYSARDYNHPKEYLKDVIQFIRSI